MSGIPHHMYLHPGRNVYSTSWFILSVLFFIGGETSEVPTCVEDSLSHRTLLEYQCLPNQLVHTVYVVFDRQWQHLWSLHKSGIHHLKDLQCSSNVYPSSWFILSVLFLTGGGMFVFHKCVRDPKSHRSPPQ